MMNANGLETFDRSSLERFAREWEAMFDRGDARAMAASYAEGATLIATGTSSVEGREAIEQFWRASCDRAKAVGIVRTVHPMHVESEGSLAYSRGTVQLRVGTARVRTVRYVTLWRREADGVWRCFVDISTQSPAE